MCIVIISVIFFLFLPMVFIFDFIPLAFILDILLYTCLLVVIYCRKFSVRIKIIYLSFYVLVLFCNIILLLGWGITGGPI